MLDTIFYSYSHPNGIVPFFTGVSLGRKPNPKNLFIAAARLDLDLTRSWFVGDRETDMLCAMAANVRPILIDNIHVPVTTKLAVMRAANLTKAAAYIIEHDFGRDTG